MSGLDEGEQREWSLSGRIEWDWEEGLGVGGGNLGVPGRWSSEVCALSRPG